VDLVDQLNNIHNYTQQHLKLASDRTEACYDRLANCVVYYEGDNVWLCQPTRMKGKSPKLESLWEGPYRIVSQIDNVYRIQWNPGSRIMVVHLDRLALYQGTAWGEHP
jgi:hypothetical protein